MLAMDRKARTSNKDTEAEGDEPDAMHLSLHRQDAWGVGTSEGNQDQTSAEG